MSAVDGLAGLLQFSDGFIEQAHFAESDTEVVVGFGSSSVAVEPDSRSCFSSPNISARSTPASSPNGEDLAGAGAPGTSEGIGGAAGAADCWRPGPTLAKIVGEPADAAAAAALAETGMLTGAGAGAAGAGRCCAGAATGGLVSRTG